MQKTDTSVAYAVTVRNLSDGGCGLFRGLHVGIFIMDLIENGWNSKDLEEMTYRVNSAQASLSLLSFSGNFPFPPVFDDVRFAHRFVQINVIVTSDQFIP